MIAVLVLGSFWLIFLYNESVDLEHQISDGQILLRKLHAEKAEMQDKMFALSSDANLRSAVSRGNLVEDKAPEYFKTEKAEGKQQASIGR